MPFIKFLLAAALATCAAAQTSTTTTASATDSTTVISIFHGGATPTETTKPNTSLEASVITAHSGTTILEVGCKGNCESTSYTVSQGPSTYQQSISQNLTKSVKACKITSSTKSAVCTDRTTYSIGGTETSSVRSTSTSYDSKSITYQPVTVTAGVEKLKKPEATHTTDSGAGRVGMGGAAVVAAAAAAHLI
ncbi:hypothetical protein ASPWEDRAFT_172608 [Aspergillus wentii DTO 134E9]|uniref:GPI anchored cell wall protein n=1 Tax=Aspergillus wentii DTO 134E9 TaxID=1073089 RepID=A0A1L9RLQ5_ASPWE|nr:uncharacterized protein ASPWEDRAFT_172608 [Aspergillus wentii DTO 134E9]KAI9929729.1 hypothetical protein MW887_001205 [Aspergillus wentii]OJJ35813.1 hypothetical protein ASPWEDRAFT_172608 [Aspergillus wentii DTO 134E9]